MPIFNACMASDLQNLSFENLRQTHNKNYL